MTDNPWVDGPLGHAIRTRYLVRANRLAATLDAVRPAPRPVKAVKAESEVSK